MQTFTIDYLDEGEDSEKRTNFHTFHSCDNICQAFNYNMGRN